MKEPLEVRIGDRTHGATLSECEQWAGEVVQLKSTNEELLNALALASARADRAEARAEHFRGMIIKSGMFGWFLDEYESSVAASDET